MKAIYLPCVIEKIVKIFCYITITLIDLLRFILAPVAWMKFKAHAIMVALTGVFYAYLRFFAHHDRAFLLAIAAFCVATGLVAFIKLARKTLKRIREYLMRMFYSPVGICIYIRPISSCFTAIKCNKLSKCGSFR